MALDLALLERSIALDWQDPVVRVYAWHPPTLSVGANVSLPPDVLDRCAAEGVAVVRRATGGSCVLHDGDVTYSIVGPDAGRGVLEAYRWVAACLIAGLAHLGIEAVVAEHGGGQTGARPLDCFAAATGADLQVAGRKICGSAQLRRRGWFLQHGSLPISDNRGDAARLLGGSVDQASTCLDRLRPGTMWREVSEALIAGFAEVWGSEARALQESLGMV